MDIIKESMITPVRRYAGLGDPLNEYRNNDVEERDFMIKYTLEFSTERLHDFIESVRGFICLQ